MSEWVRAGDLPDVAENLGYFVNRDNSPWNDGMGCVVKNENVEISIIWHRGSYSGRSNDSDTVEIWVTGEKDVRGWVSVGDVVSVLMQLSSQNNLPKIEPAKLLTA